MPIDIKINLSNNPNDFNNGWDKPNT
jgi:hypothetical protein